MICREGCCHVVAVKTTRSAIFKGKVKKLSFESLCKENFRQHLDDLNFGKFVVNNLIVDKL